VQLNGRRWLEPARAELDHISKAVGAFYYQYDKNGETELWRDFKASGAALAGRNVFFTFVFLEFQQLEKVEPATNLSINLVEEPAALRSLPVDPLRHVTFFLEHIFSGINYMMSSAPMIWIGSTRLWEPITWPNGSQDVVTLGSLESMLVCDSPSVLHYIIVASLRFLIHRFFVIYLEPENRDVTPEDVHFLGAIYVFVATCCCGVYRA
jgi:hypothetical protein